MLLVMHIPASIVTSADISQLWVYLCYVLIYGLRLELLLFTNLYVYGAWVTLYCIYVYKLLWSCVVTSASI